MVGLERWVEDGSVFFSILGRSWGLRVGGREGVGRFCGGRWCGTVDCC